MYGRILMPSFAIAWYAPQSCMAVTATNCPIPARDCDALSHILLFGFGSIPNCSPGSSMPVFAPNPNFRMYSYSRFGPKSYASFPMTMFDEWTIASFTVIVASQTCVPSPGRRKYLGSSRLVRYTVCGVTKPASIAAAAVIVFITEPGS